jgi:hypothetical protein
VFVFVNGTSLDVAQSRRDDVTIAAERRLKNNEMNAVLI